MSANIAHSCIQLNHYKNKKDPIQ